MKRSLVVLFWILTTVSSFAGVPNQQNSPSNNSSPSSEGANSIGNGNKHSQEFDDANFDDNDNTDIIVQFKTPPTSKDFNKLAAFGASVKAQHGIIKAVTFHLSSGQAKKLVKLLENDPDIKDDVKYITPDRHASLMGTIDATHDYHRETIGADVALASGWNGTGIGVAVIDSGITPEDPDIKTFSGNNRLVYSQDFTGGDGKDHYGHGGHVAGIIGGSGKSSTCDDCFYQISGIAPKITFINLRVLDQKGSGSDSNVIAAIQTAISLKAQYNIRIINLSLGRPVFESFTLDPLCQAVEAAWKAGIVVVVAAGNEGRNNSVGNYGYGTILAPGNDPYVITVGAMNTNGTATRSDDTMTTYSSKGPTLIDHIVKPDIVAPGNRIVSVLSMPQDLAAILPGTFMNNVVPTTYFKLTDDPTITKRYFRLSGTSMAAPMVSGAAALLLQKTPSLTPDQVKARLMKTASKSFPSYTIITDPTSGLTFNIQYDIFTVGAGYLDINAALANTNLANGPALSPGVIVDPVTGKVSLDFANSVAWGSSVAWGESLSWGDSVAWGESLSWGDSVVWGESVVWGSNVLLSGSSVCWGNSVVWGETSTSAFSVIWGTTSAAASSVTWGESMAWGTNILYGMASTEVINGE